MSYFLKAAFVFIGLSLASPTFADSLFYDIAKDNEVLSVITKAKEKQLRPSLTVVSWNIHKAEDGHQWAHDFIRLAKNADLFLTQESVMNPLVKETLNRLSNFNFTMATSFFMGDSTATGVMTGSTAEPEASAFLRSPDTEPIAGTPKMALLQKFSVEGVSQPLLVVNVHAINFTLTGPFKRQMKQIVKQIKNHTGPVIFAGDFNTWNPWREDALAAAIKSAGLTSIEVPNDSRFLQLDHIFVRGISVKSVQLLDKIDTSDHYPLLAQLEVLPTPTGIFQP